MNLRLFPPASGLAVGVLAALLSACHSTQGSPPPIEQQQVADETTIVLGNDQYVVQAKPVSAGKAKTQDVEFVLTKSKEISVGITSDAPQGRVQNDDVPFVPASITKILTAAVAFRQLGADFKFKTRIGFELSPTGQATNLIIYADGDPTVGAKNPSSPATKLSEIAVALKVKGVREISGSVVLVSADPRIDAGIYAPGIADEDMRQCYGALSSTFNFGSNCAPVRVNAKTGFRFDGAGAGDYLANVLETSAGDRTSLSLAPLITANRALQGFALRGTYNAKAPKTLQFHLPVANGAGWYFAEFLKALKDNQIGVAKATLKFAKTPAEITSARAEFAKFGDRVVTIESPPLSAIAATMNKHSDNFLADSLFKAVGSRLGGDEPSLATSSRRQVSEALEGWLAADGHRAWSEEFQFYDGAGLSADNRASARAFLAVLRQIAKEPTFPALWESLPIAGVDGTLADRMRGTPAAGNVRGKTGTLSGSYQLIGFIPKGTGASVEYVPFVILTSTTARNRGLVRKFQDAIVAKMYESVNKF